MPDITLIRVVSLALVDAINPCAFAVMTMVLLSILIANPGKRLKVLYGGLYFTLAVFLGYFLYGLIIIQLFKSFVGFTSTIYPYLTKLLALGAIFLGILNIKDFFHYRPGGIATEMPLKLRPLAKLTIKKITSPGSAFVIGILVTMFLLPCTIGPYIIASGSLSSMNFSQTIPWLLMYNLIFISPMLLITLLVYFGFSTLNRLDSWKERKVRYMHLIAGLMLIALGIAILTKLI